MFVETLCFELLRPGTVSTVTPNTRLLRTKLSLKQTFTVGQLFRHCEQSWLLTVRFQRYWYLSNQGNSNVKRVLDVCFIKHNMLEAYHNAITPLAGAQPNEVRQRAANSGYTRAMISF